MIKKIFLIKGTVYPFDTLVAFGSTRNEILNWLRKHGILLSIEEDKILQMHGRARAVMLTSGQTILWTRDPRSEINGTVAHEIFHIVCFIFDKIGIEFSDSNNEAFAYFIEYLTDQIRLRMK